MPEERQTATPATTRTSALANVARGACRAPQAGRRIFA